MQPHPPFAERLALWQQRVEQELALRLPDAHVEPQRLHAAMRYSVLGGGKRVRPALVYATAAALGTTESRVDGVAIAVELIHVYSLVHDDLPAMDDDELRRGRPTCHKAFDEPTAILAGDSLQVLAFQTLANGPGLPSDAKVRLILIDLLAKASGTSGMAGGQALDLAAVGQQLSSSEVEDIHARKTGALIHACVMMAASCAFQLEDSVRDALDRYARALGMAFQIQDDLLDIEGDPSLLGKPTGADRAMNKPTYPFVVGVEAARSRMRELHASAINALDTPGLQAESLIALANWLVSRRF